MRRLVGGANRRLTLVLVVAVVGEAGACAEPAGDEVGQELHPVGIALAGLVPLDPRLHLSKSSFDPIART
jgi:hypothetical protein